MLNHLAGASSRVSVAMSTFNHAPYVDAAMAGVLMQPRHMLERVVVVDDASTDGTRERLAAYTGSYPELVHVIAHRERRGSNATLEEALSRCDGEYIALLDGDDYWSDSLKLWRQVEYLRRCPSLSMCFHNVRVLSPLGGTHLYNSRRQQEIVDKAQLVRSNPVATSSVMIRRSALSRLPRWGESLVCADWLLYLLLAERGAIGYLREPMAMYRVHAAGMWSGLDIAGRMAERVAFHDALRRNWHGLPQDVLAAQVVMDRLEEAFECVVRGNGRRAASACAAACLVRPRSLRAAGIIGRQTVRRAAVLARDYVLRRSRHQPGPATKPPQIPPGI
jgi:glycosyltransferase involved in cell wall biosynthesis